MFHLSPHITTAANLPAILDIYLAITPATYANQFLALRDRVEEPLAIVLLSLVMESTRALGAGAVSSAILRDVFRAAALPPFFA